MLPSNYIPDLWVDLDLVNRQNLDASSAQKTVHKSSLERGFPLEAKDPWSLGVQVEHDSFSLVMLTLQTTPVHVFLVLNTTEINTNGRADCRFLGLHETQLRSKRGQSCLESAGYMGS